LLVKLRPNLRSPASNYHQVVTECGPWKCYIFVYSFKFSKISF
jgi:hypothetical protein